MALALGLTLLVRFWGLPGSGLVSYDEGWAARNGRAMLSSLSDPRRWSELSHIWPGDWKPGHDLLLGTLLAAGIPPDDLTWFGGVAGAVMVIALAAVAFRRWGAPAAALAGVFAGATPLTIFYGHHVLSEADGLAALAIALLLWDRCWRPSSSRRLLAATLLAFVVTLSINYRLLPTMVPLAIALWWTRRQPTPVRNWQLFGLCLSPAALMLAVYLGLLAYATLTGRDQVTLPYQLQNTLLRPGLGAPAPFAFPDFYPRTFWEFSGPAFAVALAVGVMAVVLRRRELVALDAVAAGTLVGTLLFFSVVHDKAPRAVVVAVPFAALTAARGATLGRRPLMQWAAAAALCAACLAAGWVGSGPARDLSGTGPAGRWLAARPGAIAAERTPTFELYGGARVVNEHDFSTAGALRRAGIRWAVVDSDAWVLGGTTATLQLATCGRPVAEFADEAGWSRIHFLEGADTLHSGYDDALAVRAQALSAVGGRKTIRIYDLEGQGTSGCD